MNVLFPVSMYVGAVVVLTSAGVIAVSLLSSPSASNVTIASGAVEETIATGQKPQIVVRADGTAFRYGPEVNHGRGDTPTYARAQALREAKAMAPPNPRNQIRQGQAAQRSTVTTTFSHGLSSGH